MAENLLSPSTGLSKSKLEKTTADPSDVMAGKTFYSGNQTLKTGSFNLSSANATSAYVVNGYSFYSNGNKNLQWGSIWTYGSEVWAASTPIKDNDRFHIPFPTGAYLQCGNSGYPEILVMANDILSQMKTASFSLQLSSNGGGYGETKETTWNPGGTVIGISQCYIYTDTQSGLNQTDYSMCEVSNGSVRFVNRFTHRGGVSRATGIALYI